MRAAPAERFITSDPRRFEVNAVTPHRCSSTMKLPEMAACASHKTGAEKQNRKSSGSVMEASDAVKASGSS